MTTWPVRTKALIFYGFNIVVLALIMTKHLKDILPHAAATQIGHNSEGFLLALLLGLTIQYIRPAALRSSQPWIIMGGLAIALFAIGLLLLAVKSDISSTVATLNEAFIGAGVIVAYTQLPRPLAAAPYLAAAMFLIIVIFNRTELITNQAESLVFIMLAPISFDIADPTILDRRAQDRPMPRVVWMVLLVLIPLAFAVLDRVSLGGMAEEIARYGRRPTEAFLGLFLLHLYFSYFLSTAWRGGTARTLETPKVSAT